MPDDPIDDIPAPEPEPIPAPAPEPDPVDVLEGETFRAVKKFNRAVKLSREPVRENPPSPAPAPAPAPAPEPPGPTSGRGIFDPFRRRR